MLQAALDIPARRVGTRVLCYCVDCQTAARALGAEEILGPGSGTDLWQTTPDRLQIDAGAAHLAILRLSPRGLFRWYAACCDTPLCNTLPRLGFPFLGVILRDRAAADEALGPVFAHVGTAGARPRGSAPAEDRRFQAAGMRVLQRAFAAFASGRSRTHPLRGPDGTALAPIRVLSRTERTAARP
jgi:hypothetical protein